MVEARLRVPDEIAVRVPAADMKATVVDAFAALGLPAEDAELAADVLVWADLRGVESHGVSNMMPVYVQGLKSGAINPTPRPRVIREAPATVTVDSDRGLGLVVGPRMMRLAIEKARACGVGAVAVTNGKHFGAAGYHARLALDDEMIGIAMTVGGKMVVPTHGAQPMIGLNPLAIAAPADQEPPFLFDASMSSVAGNKIRLARRVGAQVAGGWIAKSDGTPIMEDADVPDEFLMLPLGATREIGSHKGYSLAVMVDILSGVLAGTGPGFLAGANVSHHFLAYRVDAFTDVAQFKQSMDSYLRGLRETPPAPGHDRVVYAGLPDYEEEQERSVRGIPYHPDVVAYYRGLAAELGFDDRMPKP